MGHRVPFVPQMAAEDCGPACLTMLLAWHGHRAPLMEVRDKCGAGRSGTTAFDLVMAAQAFGLDGKGFGEIEPETIPELVQEHGPLILHWGLNHMVVCEGGGRSGLRVLDPAQGAYTASWSEAGRKVSGVVLVFRKGKGFQPRRQMASATAAYLREIRSSRRAALAIVAAGLLGQVLVILPNLGVGLALSSGPGTPASVAFAAVAGLALGALLGVALDFQRGVLSASVATQENERFYREVLHKLLSLPIGWLQARGSSELAVRLMQIQRILGEMTTGLLAWFTQASTAVACASVLAFILPLVAVYTLCTGGLLVMLAARLGERERLRKRPFLLATGRLGFEASEVQRALPWLEVSGLRRWAAARLQSRAAQWRGHLVNAAEASQTASLALGATSGLLDGGLLMLAGWKGISGTLSLGGVAAIVSLGTLLRTAVVGVGEATRAIRVASNTLDRASDILQAEWESRGTHQGSLRGALELERVSFAYWPGSAPVLSEISFAISPGEMIGLVGPSGCGKSTLGALLAAVRLPSTGRILLDQVDSSAWDEACLRRQVGLALQAPEILEGTFRLNLALGRDAADVQLRAALEMACLDRVVARLGGLDASIEPGGRNLSGGERQRLALARVLLSAPVLLILDEATSALDLALEREVHANLRSLSATRVLITHRRGSLEMADRVIEMDSGRVKGDSHV